MRLTDWALGNVILRMTDSKKSEQQENDLWFCNQNIAPYLPLEGNGRTGSFKTESLPNQKQGGLYWIKMRDSKYYIA